MRVLGKLLPELAILTTYTPIMVSNMTGRLGWSSYAAVTIVQTLEDSYLTMYIQAIGSHLKR